MEAQVMQKDTKEEDVFKARVQPLIEMQPSAMEIDMNAPGVTEARRCKTIMDRPTLLNKGIHIPNPNQLCGYK